MCNYIMKSRFRKFWVFRESYTNLCEVVKSIFSVDVKEIFGEDLLVRVKIEIRKTEIHLNL